MAEGQLQLASRQRRWFEIHRGLGFREARDGWVLATPFILGFIFWWAGPMLYSLFLVSTNWDLMTPPKFVGWGNVLTMVDDPKITLSLANTAFVTFIGVPLHLSIALGLALALNVKLRGQPFYRTVFFLPSITPVVASSMIWLQIFHAEFGLLNSFLRLFGMPGAKWLWEPNLAKPAFIFMGIWGIGGAIVIFLASLQGVPETLKEAAAIDGAGKWQQFLHITVPMISPVIFFMVVLGIIGGFQANFVTAYIMTAGGPQDATLFTVLYIYRNAFQYFKMGYAATVAWMLFGVIMIFTLIQFRMANRWVYYEVS